MPHSLTNIRFLTSAASLGDLPPDDAPEVVFAGRSNVGKSSAINALSKRRGLARTSKTPGRTQAVNFFQVAGGGRIVDLPGYGFARVPERVRRQWANLIEGYLSNRSGLKGVMLLMDARRPLKTFDWQMLEWANYLEHTSHVLLTKADKLGRGRAKSQYLGVRRELEKEGMRPGLQLFSATAPSGLDEAEAQLMAWLSGDGI